MRSNFSKFTIFSISFLAVSILESVLQVESCNESFSLAERRDRADVIINGIATSISGDSARVQIIQILQDPFSFLTTSDTQIQIFGLTEPEICDNSLTVNLVQIIPLSLKEDNTFYLNSSVVEVSIDSLKIIRESSAVKENPCKTKSCDSGKICRVSSSKKAECICEPCAENESEYEPVCATNNVVYSNKCQVRKAACELQTEISVLKEGFCDDPCTLVKCGFGARCVPSVDRKTANCECSDICPSVYEPVCTSDGGEFSNNCELQSHICRNQVSVSVLHNSECNPCKSVSCPENTKCKVGPKDRTAVCSCGENCLAEVKTVCGSDGHDYPNECELQRHACLLNRKIEIVAHHSCRELAKNPCSSTTCNHYAECMLSVENPSAAAECTCPFVCDPIYEPVCGRNEKDGSLQQFDSECMLKLTSCTQQRSISLVSQSVCSKIPKEIETISSCVDIDCEIGTECEIGQSNEAKCVCAESCSDFGYNPVCGSDERTYANECEFKRSICLNKLQNLLYKIRDGECPNACNDVTCDNYAECRTNLVSGKPECVCPNRRCSVESAERVCGSDSKSYRNLCEMRDVSCRINQTITPAFYGRCDQKDLCSNLVCPKYSICQKGTCVCESCENVEKELICGSDGRNYKNECEMRKQSCEQMKNIVRRHYGTCMSNDGTAFEMNVSTSQKQQWKCSEKCLHGSCHFVDKVWQCVCPKCGDEPEINTICGEDNKTYRSKCHLKQSMCMQQREIEIMHHGSCDSVRDCPINSEIIRLPRGSGFLECDSDSACPVSSFCSMAKCCFHQNTAINCSTTMWGCCADRVTFALDDYQQGCPEKCNCNELGSYGGRCDLFNQCVCRKGVTGKRCDRCSHGFWNFIRMQDHPFLGCQECNCNVNGSQRADCDQTTGDCSCKPGVFGKKCDLCPAGLKLSPSGCVSQSNLDVLQFFKSCDGVVCDHGATCVKRGEFATCECPTDCPKESEWGPVVCGSDGQTYSHECEMAIKGCAKGKTLTVSSYGACTVDTIIFEHPETSRIVEVPLNDETGSQSFDKCQSLSCKHGGQCIDTPGKGHECLCSVGTGGKRCEQQRPVEIPQFSSRSYLRFPILQIDTKNSSLSVNIKPSSEHGLIMYIGLMDAFKKDAQENYMAVYLEEGVLKAKITLNGVVKATEVSMPVLADQWHSVEIKLRADVMTLKITPNEIGDFLKNFETSSKTAVPNGKFSSDLYIGGLPLEKSRSILKMAGVSDGFSGCMTGLSVNGIAILMSYPESRSLIDGFGIDSCTFNPCDRRPCQNEGTCIVEDSFKYWCVCKFGFDGNKCEIEDDPCKVNPCQNGGTCQKIQPGFKCFCPLGTKGETCEKIVKSKQNEIFMPSLNMDSYLRTSKVQMSDYLDIEIWFFTRKLKGLLLYVEENSDYVIVEIDNHYLTFRCRIGLDSVSIVAKERLHSHSWYKVSIAAKSDTFRMKLGKTEQRVSLLSKMEKFEFAQPIFVGGLPVFKTNDFVSSKSGFRGIIQFLEINGQKLIGNFTSQELSDNFDQYFNVIGWRNHQCYESTKCEIFETCLPDLESHLCKCSDKKCGKKEIDVENTNKADQMDQTDFSTVSFDGSQSYVIYNQVVERITSQSGESYRFSFKTQSANGVIFWANENSLIDYFVVGIWNGYLYAAIDLEAGKTEVFSISLFNDDRWHFASIDRNDNELRLKVGSDPLIIARLNSGATRFDTNGLLWIGGLPDSDSASTLTPGSSNGGFQGCLSSMVVNGFKVDLYMHSLTNNKIDPCT